jgi:hypothetical protein
MEVTHSFHNKHLGITLGMDPSPRTISQNFPAYWTDSCRTHH